MNSWPRIPNTEHTRIQKKYLVLIKLHIYLHKLRYRMIWTKCQLILYILLFSGKEPKFISTKAIIYVIWASNTVHHYNLSSCIRHFIIGWRQTRDDIYRMAESPRLRFSNSVSIYKIVIITSWDSCSLQCDGEDPTPKIRFSSVHST